MLLQLHAPALRQGDQIGALTDWRPVTSLQPGKTVAEDFDGLKPNTLLQKLTNTLLSTPNASKYEIYRWPGGQSVRVFGVGHSLEGSGLHDATSAAGGGAVNGVGSAIARRMCRGQTGRPPAVAQASRMQ